MEKEVETEKKGKAGKDREGSKRKKKRQKFYPTIQQNIGGWFRQRVLNGVIVELVENRYIKKHIKQR